MQYRLRSPHPSAPRAATFPAGEGFFVSANIDYSDTVTQDLLKLISRYFLNNCNFATYDIDC